GAQIQPPSVGFAYCMISTTAPSIWTNATVANPSPTSNGSASTSCPSTAASTSATRYATWGSVRSGPVTGVSGSNRSHSTWNGCARGLVTHTRVASPQLSPTFFSSVLRPTWSSAALS